MLGGQCHRDRRPPRMSENDGPLDSEALKRLPEQIRLHRRGPDNVPGARAMSEARAIEHNRPIRFGCQIDQTARFEVLDHAAIAMKKNERPAATTLHIVQANPVDLDEPSLGGIVALRLLGKLPIYEGRRGQKKSSCSGNRDNGVSTQRSVALELGRS